MFQNLEWKAGFRRASIFMVLYAVILYVMSTFWPGTFGISEGQFSSIVIQGIFFFLILGMFFSFTEKRRRERMEALRAKKGQSQKQQPDGEEGDTGPLKGRPNPNTSRKKARRRR